MLCTDFVPCSDNAAFQERKGALHGVGVNLSHDVDTTAVIDSLVLLGINLSLCDRRRVDIQVVGNDSFHILGILPLRFSQRQKGQRRWRGKKDVNLRGMKSN